MRYETDDTLEDLPATLRVKALSFVALADAPGKIVMANAVTLLNAAEAMDMAADEIDRLRAAAPPSDLPPPKQAFSDLCMTSVEQDVIAEWEALEDDPATPLTVDYEQIDMGIAGQERGARTGGIRELRAKTAEDDAKIKAAYDELKASSGLDLDGALYRIAQLNHFMDELRRVSQLSRDRYGYALCYRCWHDCGMDTVVPHDVWKKISPRGDEGGMLCPWCIDELCAEQGITTTARLYFVGKAVSSELPESDVRDAQPAQPAQDVSALVEATPDDIRAAGWAVAVHNDYRLHGVAHTFWLFTKGDRAVKGEGRTDADALNQVRAALASQMTPAQPIDYAQMETLVTEWPGPSPEAAAKLERDAGRHTPPYRPSEEPDGAATGEG